MQSTATGLVGAKAVNMLVLPLLLLAQHAVALPQVGLGLGTTIEGRAVHVRCQGIAADMCSGNEHHRSSSYGKRSNLDPHHIDN